MATDYIENKILEMLGLRRAEVVRFSPQSATPQSRPPPWNHYKAGAKELGFKLDSDNLLDNLQ